ncbi:MAG TPA: phenylacetic acid degradation protein PaaY [Rhodospirillales bacterium]|jgi:phenylacetic acid degradation protein|nr:phenylacetic acid degradation protein PaaY [Rhodospirillales bacterium]
MVKVYAIDGVVPVVHPSAFVHPSAVLIGDVVVGADCYIGACAALRGDIGRILVEAGANVQDQCVLHCFPQAECRIGPWGHVGHGAVLHGASVGAHALVGMNSVLMDGCEIGDYAFVAAMSFVAGGFVVPPRSLAAGIPAKVRRTLTDDEIAWKRRGTEEYQRIAKRSRESMREVEALTEVDQDRPSLPVEAHHPLHVVRGR